jgi:hypothetical protein
MYIICHRVLGDSLCLGSEVTGYPLACDTLEEAQREISKRDCEDKFQPSKATPSTILETEMAIGTVEMLTRDRLS